MFITKTTREKLLVGFRKYKIDQKHQNMLLFHYSTIKRIPQESSFDLNFTTRQNKWDKVIDIKGDN